MGNTKFAHYPPLKISSRRIHLQETLVVRNKIEDILSRVATLEANFATLPGDVDEQSRRSELIRYAILFLWDSTLTSFQQAQGHRGEIAVLLREARVAAT